LETAVEEDFHLGTKIELGGKEVSHSVRRKVIRNAFCESIAAKPQN
jgi:hypothetical protein